MFRIGITGFRGLLGSKFLKHDGAIPIEADILDFGALVDSIDAIKPQAIIHCAAITGVDLCEQKPELAWQTNYYGTANVLKASQGVPVALISTDYVFPGSKEDPGPYK